VTAAARMPVVFIGHGNPMNALEDNDITRRWGEIGHAAPAPRAILCVSAHWQTRGPAVTAMPKPRTIHDFGAFPPELFAVHYPAPGDPALAHRVGELLAPSAVTADQRWGLDHGAWSVLVHMRPDADVPIVQLSLDVALDARGHYELARRLAPLRDEGVLVMGSGNVVHNLGRMVRSPDAAPQPWALRFEGWARERIESGDHDALIDYQQQGEDARLSVPTAEHYLPLLYCLALARGDDAVSFPTIGVTGATLSMLSVGIGLAPLPGQPRSV
jgi:4,5-DOPA dioxygenase extradiol